MEDKRGIREALKQVQGLSAVAAREQVQSIMEVVGRCTLHIGDGLEQLALDIHKAKEILGNRIEELTGELKSANEQMSKASEEASKHTAVLVKWTKVMAFVSGVYVVLTGGLLIVALLALFRSPH
jgi:prefoldin subunit 5